MIRSELFVRMREALALLFPNAVPADAPSENLKTAHSFFLRDGETLFWVELAAARFSREGISDYLSKVHQIEAASASRVCGILGAPDFEPGVQELLELIRIPVRLFHYREAILWIEELTSRSVMERNPPFPPLHPGVAVRPPAAYRTRAWNRLSREELREFVQLELDSIKFA